METSNSKIKKILKISSTWCGPCRQLKKELEDFDLVPIIEVDADKDEQLCNDYGIKSIPTLIFLDEKEQEVFRHVGFIFKKDLRTLVDKLNE